MKLPGDPRGEVVFDLGNDSMFDERDSLGKRYYGAFYDVNETNPQHQIGRHRYVISKSPIIAVVFINLPKL